MRLRTVALIVTLALGLLAAPLPAEAQKPGKVYQLAVWGHPLLRTLSMEAIWPEGVLTLTQFLDFCSESGPRAVPRSEPVSLGFCQGLRELGYVDRGEDANLKVFYIFEREASGGLAEIGAELARFQIDTILALTTPAALSAKKVTRTIPVVFVGVPDPVAAGLVASLGQAGGNMTGVTNILTELRGKQLELLKETVPGLSRAAVLWNPIGGTLGLKEAERAAQALGVTLQSLRARGPEDFKSAFSAMNRGRPDGLLVIPDDMFWAFKKWIVDLTKQHRLPTIFWTREFVDRGGLMAYGPDLRYLGLRAAHQVDKILKGTNPAGLPVEQPTKFELVINLRTAKVLGLTIPGSLLFRADRVTR